MLLFRVAVSLHLMAARVSFGAMGGVLGWTAAELLRLLILVLATTLFPALVMVGLFSRLASVGIIASVLLGGMLLGLPAHPLPYLYGITYLLLLALGPGKYSADFLINRSLTRR
ncbi:hypothetical protein [uncultured Hymenobacter sp.]|uniref:hypothetical protein n=1 Tax=uncultured Hymenobacter sp. TaxID=170016 RepID=UPI0035CC420F